MSRNAPQAGFSFLKPLGATAALSCPDCGLTMTPYSCKDRRVDKCPSCQGLWFGGGAFAVFRTAMQEFDLSELRVVLHSNITGLETIPGCPHCGVALAAQPYSYNSKVVLRRCGDCAGIWLSRLDLLNLVELTSVGQFIAPHLSAATRELTRMEEERRKGRKLARLAEALMAPVRNWLS